MLRITIILLAIGASRLGTWAALQQLAHLGASGGYIAPPVGWLDHQNVIRPFTEQRFNHPWMSSGVGIKSNEAKIHTADGLGSALQPSAYDVKKASPTGFEGIRLALFKQKNPKAYEILKDHSLLVNGEYSRAIEPLNPDTFVDWTNLKRKVENLPADQKNAIEEYMERELSLTENPKLEKQLSIFRWNMNRLKRNVPIWWTKKEIELWQTEKLNWQAMANLGDLLKFSDVNPATTLGNEYVQRYADQLIRVFQNAQWQTGGPSIWKSLLEQLSKSSNGAPKEVKALRSIRETQQGPLYDLRLKEFASVIEGESTLLHKHHLDAQPMLDDIVQQWRARKKAQQP